MVVARLGEADVGRSLVLALALALAVASAAAEEFAAAVEAARQRCDADPDSVVESADVAAHDGLRVNCHPPLKAPPCISEAFFHSKSKKSVNYLGQGGGPKDYAVCKTRRRYEDWPTVEPHVPLTVRPGDGITKRAEDIAALIGPYRRVLIVGASTARQLHEATLCSLASAPGGRFDAMRAQFQFWWRNKYREASGGCTRRAAAASCARRNLTASPRSPICEHYMLSDKCFSNGTAFAKTLDRFDVVIVAFDPQHYGGSHISTRAWMDDMTFLFLELSRWRERHANDPGRAAFVREGSALHFVGGQYKKPPKFAKPGAPVGPQSTCICAHAEKSWAHKNPAWQATEQLNLVASRNKRVHVIPFYNVTLPRDDMHKGDMCSYRMRRVNGIATPEAGSAGAALARAAAAARAAATGLAGKDDDEVVGFTGEGGEGGGASEVFRRRRRLKGVRPIRACCDCLHLCYSPAFYDTTFYTPIWHALVRDHAYRPASSS